MRIICRKCVGVTFNATRLKAVLQRSQRMRSHSMITRIHPTGSITSEASGQADVGRSRPKIVFQFGITVRLSLQSRGQFLAAVPRVPREDNNPPAIFYVRSPPWMGQGAEIPSNGHSSRCRGVPIFAAVGLFAGLRLCPALRQRGVPGRAPQDCPHVRSFWLTLCRAFIRFSY